MHTNETNNEKREIERGAKHNKSYKELVSVYYYVYVSK